MADAAPQTRRKVHKKFSYRGVDVADLLKMNLDEFTPLLHARGRRKFKTGLSPRTVRFLAKLEKAKAATPEGEKPPPVKTHLRNVMVIPEMLGSVVAVYNGKVFNVVELRPEMLGRYLGEFSITYKPVARKTAGSNAPLSRMVSLK